MSSSRRDGAQLSHWVRSDMESLDYPFSRFAKRMDVIRYTDVEYRDLFTPSDEVLRINALHLQQASQGQSQNAPPPRQLSEQEQINIRWPRDHTDHLFELIRRYDLQWPVIADRFELKPPHALEDLKSRYYNVVSKTLYTRRQRNYASRSHADAAHSAFKEYEGYKYQPEEEQRRRKQLDAAFRRNNDELAEERRLLKELQLVEASIKKLESVLVKGRKPVAALSSSLASGGGGEGEAPAARMGASQSTAMEEVGASPASVCAPPPSLHRYRRPPIWKRQPSQVQMP